MSLSLNQAIQLIDRKNEVDPSQVLFEGKEYPTALIEGMRAEHWIQQLRPDAPDALLIAARGHHMRRWEIPRDSYPRTRQGYLAWRSRLYDFHAEAVAAVMQQSGYDEDAMAQAGRLMRKQGIKLDIDAQAYEDAVALAFLELRLDQFTQTVTEEQMDRALRRTWRKMSDAGHAAALTLELQPKAASAVQRALTP